MGIEEVMRKLTKRKDAAKERRVAHLRMVERTAAHAISPDYPVIGESLHYVAGHPYVVLGPFDYSKNRGSDSREAAA